MPISSTQIGARIERQWVKIVTVDTRIRRVDALLKDGGIIQVAIYEIPPFFRWPKEGEYWIIERQGTEWFLRSPAQDPDASVQVEELDQGDSIQGVDGAKIHVLGDFSAPDSSVKATVYHGTDASVTRPNYPSVEWIGSVEPLNSAIGDTWIGPTASLPTWKGRTDEEQAISADVVTTLTGADGTADYTFTPAHDGLYGFHAQSLVIPTAEIPTGGSSIYLSMTVSPADEEGITYGEVGATWPAGTPGADAWATITLDTFMVLAGGTEYSGVLQLWSPVTAKYWKGDSWFYLNVI